MALGRPILRSVADRALAGISRPILVLGLVSFFTDISSEMIYPLVPLFLSGSLGAPAAVVGLIEGIAESTASILKVPSGWLSDRLERRRPLVFLGYGLSALGKPLLALAFVWPVALLARFVDRCGKGLRTSPRDALIADLTEGGSRGKAFGLHRAMDTAGAVVGPLLAFALLAAFNENFRIVFLLAFPPAAVGVLLIRAVREGPQARAGWASTEGPQARAGRVVKERRPSRAAKEIEPARPDVRPSAFSWEFKAFLLVSLLFALGNSSDAFLLLRASRVGLSTTAVVLA
ncbi:MAG TPA: MFS transporter, partial [Dehalococcoidia bacterium]|nr:MFS transporter [Dehalococcoidia bacterium]